MKFSKIFTFSMLLVATSVGCGSKEEQPTTTPTPVTQGTFGTPANFTVTAKDQGAYIRFDRNSAAGYKLYFGTTSDLSGLGNNYQASPMTVTSNAINVGNLTNGTTYYFAVTAVDASGTESPRSQTISIVPAEPVNP